MDRSEVSSSNIAAIGYDRVSRTLEVEFKSGKVYQYHGVSRVVYDQMMDAPSKGSFLARHIKDTYQFEEV